eukprot:CAMPEP_0201525292 /NCGR_PEP_ID=MMETSP0161_2-20130828/27600_1 /ASSEMBLY_ACC=CAM_ASM_000251 /TAXON_ID=180227 /ORGANISM="Neoparamoeba aestuarina, Strain SoJaBio B1-5/56/2" /LENGTH=129 /DNA_ID=CAMNT_0047925141 /DNA_START=47 /DNA_END=433 /DNA_ORIENTATION=+
MAMRCRPNGRWGNLRVTPDLEEASSSSLSPPPPPPCPFPLDHPLSKLKGISFPLRSIFAMSPENAETMIKKLILSMLRKLEGGTEEEERRVVKEHGFVGEKEEEEGLEVLRSAPLLFPDDEEVKTLLKS